MAPENSNDTWSACQPGTLQRLSMQHRRQTARQRKRKLAAGVASGLVGVVALGLLLLNPWSQPLDGEGSRGPREVSSPSLAAQLSCPEILDRRDSYLLGNVMDAEREQILAHLDSCQHCQESYRQRASELQVGVSLLVLPPAEHSQALVAAR